MSYIASCTVILNDGELSYVEVEGASRNEALEFLGYAAMGINVVGVIKSSITTATKS